MDDKVNVLIFELKKQLISIINRDGRISTDESALMQAINTELTRLQNLINDASQDKVYTDDEIKKIHDLITEIMHKIIDIAKQDKLMTYEEEILLGTLRKFLIDIANTVSE